MVSKSRRHILRAGGLVTLPFLAGCFDPAFEQASGVSIQNTDDVPHRVTVVVSVNSNEKISQTVSVAAGNGRQIDQTLPGPGLILGRRFETTVELETGKTQTAEKVFRGANGFDEIMVYIDEDGSIDVTYADAG
jgi:hypothetical protein